MAQNRRIVDAAPVVQRPGAELRFRRIRVIADIREESETLRRRFFVARIDIAADETSVNWGIRQVAPNSVGACTWPVHPELVIQG
jgi:hypothetical protein